MTDFQIIKNALFKEGVITESIKSQLLSLIKTESNEIDMLKLSEIIDLYNYYPMRVKKDKNQSNDLYYQMFCNKKSIKDLINEKSINP